MKYNFSLFLSKPTSVLHEHATLKMVQRYSILLSKLYEVVLVWKHIYDAASKRPITKPASSEDTICAFVLEYNQHKTRHACSYLSNIY